MLSSQMLWRLLNVDIKCLLVTLARTSTYGICGALTTGPSVSYANVILNVWRARFLGIDNSTVCGSSDIGCRVVRWTIGATVSPTTFLMYLQIVAIVLPIPKHLDRHLSPRHTYSKSDPSEDFSVCCLGFSGLQLSGICFLPPQGCLRWPEDRANSPAHSPAEMTKLTQELALS